MIQYISQGRTIQEHLKNIESVCKAGGRWIQLRLKDSDQKTYLETGQQCLKICRAYKATLIINDNIEVAQRIQADGVHLGLNDASPEEARRRLGEKAIIGGTANTEEDCLQRIEEGVDYIGLGPFRFTTTKEELSPVLGLEGYQQIVSSLSKKGHQVPIVAIGGIRTEDIIPLYRTGVSGIAVSGLLSGLDQTVLQQRMDYIQTAAQNLIIEN